MENHKKERNVKKLRRDLEAKLILFAISTVIAVLICIICYCILFSQNGIVTILARTKTLIESSYQEESQTLSKLDEYIDSVIPDKQDDKIYLSYIDE